MSHRDLLALASALARITAVLLAVLLTPLAVSNLVDALSISSGEPQWVVVQVAEPQQLLGAVAALALLAAMLLCTWWVTRR